ncbi:MAG: DUF4384 domain-containing protein [Sulfurovaceae bacterium]|nr:DUF4384 domain-containing protein [Sulfurovaceae bacterium]
MYKNILLPLTALLFLSGCVTKEPMVQPTTNYIMPHKSTKCHQFANKKLCATQRVSELVNQIESLSGANGINLELNSNQNIQLGSLLDLKAIPNSDGYLKIVLINPNGKKTILLPNKYTNGFIKANQTFYSNNENFGIKTVYPKGLHYLVIIFSQSQVPLRVTQGMRVVYDGLKSDQDFIQILREIKSKTYGDSYISLFPVNIY